MQYNKGRFMKTTSYTDLKANLKSYIDAVIDNYDTVVVNHGNGKGVVMISLDEYNSLKETEYLMQRKRIKISLTVFSFLLFIYY